MAVTWQELYNLNKSKIKNPNKIYPGQVLALPDGSTYTVAEGDNLSQIASNQSPATEPEPSPTEQDVIDADPFEYARLQAITNEQDGPTEQVVLDANSDEALAEAVAAAQATNEDTSPTEQDVIDAEEDPFEQARLRNQAEEDNSPNEQQVIDASTDEELHPQGPKDLAAEQEKNRALLRAEEDQAYNGVGSSPPPTLVKNDFKQKEDWRVRISLAPHASYLYKVATDPSDILFPLQATDGVIFPYTPTVSVNYAANYEGIDVAHTNYKMYQYKNSEVGTITITGTFTAQDNKQANYLLAVMHFFKSVTKMFYGQDSNPKNGTPPPLCYLSGFGTYQFDNHPMAITGFTMSLPDDVDYIRAGQVSGYNVTTSESDKSSSSSSWWDTVKSRLKSSRLNKGGMKDEPVFTNLSNKDATYVPTRMVITITAVPMVTRNDISNNFSLAEYATGALTRGSKRQTGGGGIW